jgi:hypothetical protein
MKTQVRFIVTGNIKSLNSSEMISFDLLSKKAGFCGHTIQMCILFPRLKHSIIFFYEVLYRFLPLKGKPSM